MSCYISSKQLVGPSTKLPADGFNLILSCRWELIILLYLSVYILITSNKYSKLSTTSYIKMLIDSPIYALKVSYYLLTNFANFGVTLVLG